jgi:hypothetical protein
MASGEQYVGGEDEVYRHQNLAGKKKRVSKKDFGKFLGGK